MSLLEYGIMHVCGQFDITHSGAQDVTLFETAYASRCVYAQEYLFFYIIKFKCRKVNLKFDFAQSQLFGAKQLPIVKSYL